MTSGIDLAEIAVYISLISTAVMSVAVLIIAVVVFIEIHAVVHDILKKM